MSKAKKAKAVKAWAIVNDDGEYSCWSEGEYFCWPTKQAALKWGEVLADKHYAIPVLITPLP